MCVVLSGSPDFTADVVSGTTNSGEAGEPEQAADKTATKLNNASFLIECSSCESSRDPRAYSALFDRPSAQSDLST
jgi:hypothetical protein